MFRLALAVVGLFAILVYAAGLVARNFTIQRHEVLYLLLLSSFLPSLFYDGIDHDWARSQYLSFLLRAFPGVLLFTVQISMQNIAQYYMSVGKVTILLYYLSSGFDQFLSGNFENIGAAVLVACLPFFLIKKKYIWALFILLPLFLSDSRMGLLIALLSSLFMVVGPRLKRRWFKVLAVTFTLSVTAIVFFAARDVFFPEDLPNVREFGNERVRRAMQYFTMESITENPFLGVGMGQISILTENVWGQRILAHGFLSFIWAQSGLIALVPFLIVVGFSIYFPARAYHSTKSKIFVAIAFANINGFLFFLTRPQQDNPIFFISLVIGLLVAKLVATDMKSIDNNRFITRFTS